MAELKKRLHVVMLILVLAASSSGPRAEAGGFVVSTGPDGKERSYWRPDKATGSYASNRAGHPLRPFEWLREKGIKTTIEHDEQTCHLLKDSSVWLQESSQFRQIDDGKNTVEIRHVGGVVHLLKDSGLVCSFDRLHGDWDRLGWEDDLHLFTRGSESDRRAQQFKTLYGEE